jgi:hypothetical protein
MALGRCPFCERKGRRGARGMDLIISDLHLSDNPLEEYRWNVFDWLSVTTEKIDLDTIYILGDLTEKKDNHGAKLVNRLTGNLLNMRDWSKRMVILRGNHDGIDPYWPFFHFLSEMNIEYYYSPMIVDREMFIPYSKDFAGDIKRFFKDGKVDLSCVDRIFMHQTIKGAMVNGITLEGFDPGIFRNFNGQVYSGDIHVPQTVGLINYVGSPYPVYFGDSFVGGCILLDGDKLERIENPTIRRVMLDLDWTVDAVFSFKVNEGDQFKVRLKVNRSDSDQFDSWKKCLKNHVEEKGGILVSAELKLAEEKSRLIKKRKFKDTDPLTVLSRYCRAEGLDSYYEEKGKEFLA